MLMQMEQLWSDLETLGEVKSKSAKRATLLEAIRESYPHLFAQLATQSNLDYEMLKRSIIAAASFETFENQEKQLTLAMSAIGGRLKQATNHASRASHQSSSPSTKLQPDQCAFCLKKNHRWRECRHYLNGGRPAQRPSSMQQPDFPPPPARAAGRSQQGRSQQGVPSSNNGESRSFLALNAYGQQSGDSPAVPIHTNKSTWIIDSGANMHMTPDSSCMINCRPTTSSSTFGDGKKVHAEQVGDVVLDVDSDHGATTIVLQDVLHIPSLPCALLSTTKLRTAGGTFVDSASMRSYIQLPNNRKVPLKMNTDTNFMQLDGHVRTSADVEGTATVFATLANKSPN